MNACEFLAPLGLRQLLRTSSPTPDQMKLLQLRMISSKPKAWPNKSGCSWLGRSITWPDRVPGLVTWSGQQTLPMLIKKCQSALEEWGGADLREASVAMTGVSGIDSLVAQDAIDVGFSVDALKMPVFQRVGLELLAIYALEAVPLLSFARRQVGVLHAGQVWTWRVEAREGGYYHRWGDVREMAIDDAPLIDVNDGDDED